MDLNDANLTKTLECPVCLDFFDEPKLLICGHTLCQKCVNKVATSRRDASTERYKKCVKCPECNKETEIPLSGLTTNYRLVDLVCRARKPAVDVYACNGCGKQAPVADMFTCDTCQEMLNNKPLWFCAVCAMKQHRGHAMSECNKATRQQIRDACKGIAGSGSLADMYIGLATSHLNGALEATGLIVQLLNEQKRGFSRLEERVTGADDNLAQGDLTAALQAASDLKQKFEHASTITSEARKDLESVLQVCRQKLEELFPKEQEQVRMETEDSATEAPKVPQAIFQNRKFAFTSATRVNRAGQPQFNKRELRTLIEQRGGTAIDDFQGLSDDDDAYLVADTHYRTHKYLWALSLSVPCVHHTWITECVEQDTFVDFKEYMLAAGQALGPDGTIHEYAWYSNTRF